MSMTEIKHSIAEMTVEERREVANLIAQLNHADSPEYQRRPEGYFASDYENPDPERLRLENSYAEALAQRPER